MILVSGILFLENNAAAGNIGGQGYDPSFSRGRLNEFETSGGISSNFSEEPIKFKYFSVD